jgi:SAM-dependent methyltransferase
MGSVTAASPDDFVVLDPAVRLEDLPARKPSAALEPAVHRGWLLVHEALEVAAVLPGGAGLQEFVEDLRSPTRLADLVEAEEIGSDALAWQLLDGLLGRGFAHHVPGGREPEPRELDQLRSTWRDQCRHLRRRVEGSPGRLAIDEVVERVRALMPAPSLVLECRDEPHEVRFLVELAARYRDGDYRAHETLVALPDARCGTELRAALRRLGAGVRLRARTPLDAAALRALVEDGLTVTVEVDAGGELLAPDGPQAVADAVTAARVTTLALRLDWAALAGTGRAVPELADEIDARLGALTDALGDVRVCGFPTDDEIAQEAMAPGAPGASELERAVRVRFLQRRARYLASIEGRYVWAQDLPAEELWVPSEDDLLPNHPELLGLRDGSVLADIAGGFGRVARRLAPHVGPRGEVISVEKEPIFVSRARRFAAELGVRTVQFRIGLCQRIPIADQSVDAAVMEWGGEIQRTGLLADCLVEIRRILRPGGRVAITYRMCNVELENLANVFAPVPDILPALRGAIEAAGLPIVAEKVWLAEPRPSQALLAAFDERFLPRIVDDLRGRRSARQPRAVDLTLTTIAQKASTSR